MSLIAELRRRNVFRVGAAYAIVAWLLVEVASVVLPALHLPDWTLTFLVFLLVALPPPNLDEAKREGWIWVSKMADVT